MEDKDERPLFVETTVLIWQQTTEQATRTRIKQTLRSRKTVSSTYVKAEYITVYLQAATTAYNLLADSENVLEATHRWANSFQRQHRLQMDHLMSALADGHMDKNAVLRRLRQIIEVSILLRFDAIVQEVTDLTQCSLAQYRPRYNGKTYELFPKFPPAEAPSSLKTFLTARHEFLLRIHWQVNSNDKHWRKLKADLQNIVNGKYDLGVEAWQRLSDVIIALEAHEDQCEIYTGNVKHFALYCQAIGLPLKPEHPSNG